MKRSLEDKIRGILVWTIMGAAFISIPAMLAAMYYAEVEKEESYVRTLAEIKKDPALLQDFKECVASQGPKLSGAEVSSEDPRHFCARLIMETR